MPRLAFELDGVAASDVPRISKMSLLGGGRPEIVKVYNPRKILKIFQKLTSIIVVIFFVLVAVFLGSWLLLVVAAGG